jgi:predicted DCC family thiol-disulfide oxidoreductase YuxK
MIFDGNCVLCSHIAQFLLRRDRRRAIRLLAAQTPTAAALYVHYGLTPKIYETNILLENGRASRLVSAGTPGDNDRHRT